MAVVFTPQNGWMLNSSWPPSLSRRSLRSQKNNGCWVVGRCCNALVRLTSDEYVFMGTFHLHVHVRSISYRVLYSTLVQPSEAPRPSCIATTGCIEGRCIRADCPGRCCMQIERQKCSRKGPQIEINDVQEGKLGFGGRQVTVVSETAEMVPIWMDVWRGKCTCNVGSRRACGIL